MRRRDFIGRSAALAALAAVPGLTALTQGAPGQEAGGAAPSAPMNPLQPPAKGKIPVAFVLSAGAVMIDFAGPWQVFQDVWIPSRGPTMDDQMPFKLYTVAEKAGPIEVSGGMKIEPEYIFANAPAPKVIVIPAQGGMSKAMLNWITINSRHTDVTMSVCTGSEILAKTGLLAGKAVTTHHTAYRTMAMEFPDVQVKRGARFVETGNLASSGGLSSGIDLALRVVERYFGRKAAADTAYNLEYQGQGWMDPNSNQVYAAATLSNVSADGQPLCPVCSMEVDRTTAPKSQYKDKTYYFCGMGHKNLFDKAPDKWI